jgi:putative serine protease PepD
MSEYGFDPEPQTALPVEGAEATPPTPSTPPTPASPPSAPPPSRQGRRSWWVPVLSAFLGAALAVSGMAVINAVNGDSDTTLASPTTTLASSAQASNAGGSGAVTIPALPDTPVDAASVGAKVVPSVVTVQVGTEGANGFSGQGSGSGVIFDNAGHIVTNNHVATLGSAHQVVLADGRVFPATVVGTDPVTDLAVLQISADGLTPIQLGSSDALEVGDPAVAVGSPLGLEGGPSLTVGVLSAFGRRVTTGSSAADAETLFGMLQTDAPITQGSSGGALVDAGGRLIGITTAVGVSSIGVEGIGFATPVEIVSQVANEIIATGQATHAYLGVSVSTAMDAIEGGGSVPAGAAVETVEPGTAAANAGIKVGEVITAVDGTKVAGQEQLVALLRRYQAGAVATFTVRSATGGTSTIAVTLGELPAN